jgi:RNA polymerase sigma-70 factor (ECF subfamily)
LSTLFGRSERDEEDAQLLERIVRGEESALSTLYDRYHRLLYTFGMRMLRSVEESEDLLQEVFLQLWNTARSYDRGKGSVYTWLVTMTRNRAIDRLRSKGYKRQVQHIDIDEITLATDSHSSNPYANAELHEHQRLIVTVLQKLTLDQQQVIALSYYEGYSQSEIAAKLDIPLGTVKSRMRKGLMEMRSMLQGKL